LIGAAALEKVKPTVHIINAARGGIVDETALYNALKAGKVAGAGLDVYAKEPCTDSPLFELENVVATPHLGASTEEAQEKAGISVAKSVRLALSGELVPDAVNVRGGVIAEEVRPLLPLAENLGRIVCGLTESAITSVKVTVYGELIDHDLAILELSALKGIFSQLVDEQVSYVNAPLIAKDRGVNVELIKDAYSPNYRNLVTIEITTVSGDFYSVAGTVGGPQDIGKVVAINGFTLDLGFSDHFVLFTYQDRPGIVGKVGAIMGDAQINIAAMQVARESQGGSALLVLTVDTPVTSEILHQIVVAVEATYARVVNLH
jgi:D-3-phosphoglycerate dehydrogenase